MGVDGERVTGMQALRALVWLRVRAAARRFVHGYSNARRGAEPTGRAAAGVRKIRPSAYLVALLALSFFAANSLYLFAALHARWGRHLGAQAVPAMASFDLAALLLSNILANLGGKDEDLSNPISENSWLLTLPLSSSTLYWAKIAQAVPRDGFGWMFVFPYLTALSWRAGLRIEAFGVGVLGCLALIALSAAVRLVLEGLSHRWLRHAARRWVQHVAFFLGWSGTMTVVAQAQPMTFSDAHLSAVYDVARTVSLPGFSDLVRVALQGLTPATALSFCAFVALVALVLLLGKLVFSRSVRYAWWGPTTMPSRRGQPLSFFWAFWRRGKGGSLGDSRAGFPQGHGGPSGFPCNVPDAYVVETGNAELA